MFTNTPQQLAEKKLLLLYILDKTNQPLSNAEITQFILENDMMNYFMLQQFLSELKEAEFVIEKKEDHTLFLSITEKGRNTLNYFINRIASSVKKEISQLILEKKSTYKKKTEVKSDYVKIKEGIYRVNLMIIEDDVPIVDLKFHVNHIEKAKKICAKWEKEATSICSDIIKLFI